MKYTIMMSCGHEDTIDLIGKGKDRERKLEYFKSYGMCKECYKRKKEEEIKNTPLTFNATVLPYINEENGNLLLNVWFSGNTIPCKDTIKELGYRWSERKSADDYFATSKPPMCWNKTIESDDLKEEMKKAESLGAKNTITDNSLFGMVNYEIAIKKHKEWKAVKEKIESIEKPLVPEVLKGHKWNQKVYGKSGNYSVYPDGVKISITDEQANEIEEYLKQKEEYKKKMEEIKNA